MRRKVILIAPLATLGFLAFVALGGALVQVLWNWLLPGLFGWPALTFWQALGLLLLCRILFGGLGPRLARPRRRRWRQRWEGLSPEERERFRQHVHRRWGSGPLADRTTAAEGSPPDPEPRKR